MKSEKRFCRQSGAAMVEFAIVLPLLFLLIFGMIEFSIMLYDKAVITNASREGARYGITFYYNPAEDPDGDTRYSASQIEQKALAYCSNNLISLGGSSSPAVAVAGAPCTAVGSPIQVTVTYPYNFLVFPNLKQFFGDALDSTLTLSAQTVMRCE